MLNKHVKCSGQNVLVAIKAQAKTAFQHEQMLLCVNHARVSTEMPRYSWPVTYVLQFALTFPEGPKSCIAVSMSVVSQSTNRMNELKRMTPGISNRLAARMRIMRRNMSVNPAVTIPNGKSLWVVSKCNVVVVECSCVPWNPNIQLVLYRDEPCKYAQDSRCCSKDDKNPEIKLHFRPAVFPTCFSVHNFCRHLEAWGKQSDCGIALFVDVRLKLGRALMCLRCMHQGRWQT